MMAAEMQSDSMMQRTCWSNGTEPCTRVDCRLTMDLEPLVRVSERVCSLDRFVMVFTQLV